MGSSFKLFAIRGIDLRIHITFPLILIWSAIQFGLLSGQGISGATFGVIVVLLLFVIVILHELGHSFAAQYYGIPVKEIVLLPIGGVARLDHIPENPRQELVIAIAGPAVNFILAIILAGFAFIFNISILDRTTALIEGLRAPSAATIFGYIFASNLFLGVFNLLPAFPMDGGRVLRALLATRMQYVRATNIAVSVGQLMAWGLGLWGFLGGGFFLILIAFFIYNGATQEGRVVELRNIFRDVKVSRAYSRNFETLFPDDPLQRAVDLTLSSFQSDFPVIENGRFVGLLTHADLVKALKQHGAQIPVRQIMLANIVPVSPQDEMLNAQMRLAESQLEILPVVENGQLVGMISNRDISELFRLISSLQVSRA